MPGVGELGTLGGSVEPPHPYGSQGSGVSGGSPASKGLEGFRPIRI